MKDKLTRNDWIKAGFRALTAGGPQAIKAEAIARSLKVSKGSFYWHFKDLPDLKAAMLDTWSKIATFDIIEEISVPGMPAADQLKTLIKVSSRPRSQEYGGLLAEAAIRDWARYDSKTAEILVAIDTARLAFLKNLFIQHGFAADESGLKARILYASLIGLEHLEHQGNADLPADLPALLEILIASKHRMVTFF